MSLSFATLREANLKRLPLYRNAKGRLEDCSKWTPNDWLGAVLGELGEAANILKKVKRGDMTLKQARKALGKAFADTATYLDLLAWCCGVDLGEVTLEKFNEISTRVKAPVFILKNSVIIDSIGTFTAKEDLILKQLYRDFGMTSDNLVRYPIQAIDFAKAARTRGSKTQLSERNTDQIIRRLLQLRKAGKLPRLTGRKRKSK